MQRYQLCNKRLSLVKDLSKRATELYSKKGVVIIIKLYAYLLPLIEKLCLFF